MQAAHAGLSNLSSLFLFFSYSSLSLDVTIAVVSRPSTMRSSLLFRTILSLCIVSTVALAASEREMAEWVIRWEGRVVLEGNRQPINDLDQLPPGDLRIVA